jgi:hypothetical protein
MRHRIDAGETVYLLSMAGPIKTDLIQLEATGNFPLQSTMLNHQPRGIPDSVKDRGGDFVVYRVTAP